MTSKPRKPTQSKTLARSRAYASAANAPRITAAEFQAWQAELDLSNGEAAAVLFISPNTVTAARQNGGTAELGLKCRAVLAGIGAADSWADVRRLGRVNQAMRD